MPVNNALLKRIEKTIHEIAPDATVILYGSQARGDSHELSDIDLVVLLDKASITRTDEKRVKYPLYDIEFETGIIISPIVFTKKAWEEKHNKTPFYENVSREGQLLMQEAIDVNHKKNTFKATASLQTKTGNW